MVEVPAAALAAEAFAPEVDFFSIGTNDLVQYTMAAERGNEAVAGLADGLHPAVLRLIRAVAEAAEAHGKWVGVCGELASDPAGGAGARRARRLRAERQPACDPGHEGGGAARKHRDSRASRPRGAAVVLCRGRSRSRRRRGGRATTRDVGDPTP